ncbi:MAG: hypothetical protein Q8L26_06430 [Candidatus Omnitrophota bacterium]|nr:hypothetical protein [Candidatus Omnitrophota bacterium]
MNIPESPLFNPVIFKGGHIAVLDETLLPFKQEYIKVSGLNGALYVLRQMKTRAFGQVLLFYYTLILEAKKNEITNLKSFSKLSRSITEKFIQTRPTFAFSQLNNELLSMLKNNKEEGSFISLIKIIILTYIDSIQNARRHRARLAAGILPQSARILTHCNVSGELVTMFAEAEKLGKSVEFFATETRPYFQGARLTAWELNRANANTYLICDIQAGDILKRCRIDMVLVGSDRVTLKGDIVNKLGTYQLAILAKHYGVPFYCFVQPPGDTKSIKDIKIEYRPKEEMLVFEKSCLAPKSQEAIYPSFDVVPSSLITGLIFFDQIYTPGEFAKKWVK